MRPKLTFLACFFIFTNCFAQQYPFVFYTPKDGLVNSRVRYIKQDSRGRMFFLTYGGLSIYDGTKFINYGQQDGLANEVINDVMEVTPDSFLIATNGSILNVLVRGKIGKYETTDGFFPVINHFLKSSDGKLYVITDQGLYQLEKRKFKRLPVVAEGRDVLFLERIIEWKNYFLLIPWSSDLRDRIILYNKAEQKVEEVYTKDKVYSITADAKSRIWLGLANGPRLLDTIALQQGKINFAETPPEIKKFLPDPFSSLFSDRNGNYWFFSRNRFEKISADLQSQLITREQGLLPSYVYNIFEDREGNIWMGSEGTGVIKIRNTNLQVIDRIIPGIPMFISSMQIKNDTIWLFNSVDNTILRLFRNEKKVFHLDKHLTVFDIYPVGQKLYLVASGGVAVIENKDDPASYLKSRPVINDPHISFGTAIVDDYEAFIVYTLKSDTSYSLTVIKNEKIIGEFPIGYSTDHIVIDKNEVLWIAPRNSQLVGYKIHPDQPAHYLEKVKDLSNSIKDISPRCIAVDKNNVIWIGTRFNGLYRIDITSTGNPAIIQFTTRNGLTDNFIYNLLPDDNDVWVGTQTGLDKLILRDSQYIVANISKNNNIFQSIQRIAATSDRTIWVTNSQGSLLKIRRAIPEETFPLPQLLLTGIVVNNKILEDSVNRFSYTQNSFSFTVAAPSFIDEKSIRYSYKLSGSGNNNWSDPSNNASFNFINLPPGSYSLEVKADFPEAMYPSQMISYSFTISEPWWQTWWFRIMMAVASMAVLIVIFRFYYNRKLEKQKMILEKQQAIEKERTRIATDMHDDLGAGLSRIKFLSETIGIKKQQQQPIEDEISRIREYSHEMINKMGEIVWALNEKNDSLSDLLSYTRAYAVEYLSQNGIGCEVTMPDQLSANFVSGEFRRNIFLSVKEILHNVVKHSQACDVIIEVKANQELDITISDNGIGFDKKNTRLFSNGLHNIGKRMKDIHGNAEIKNNNGTTIILKAPL